MFWSISKDNNNAMFGIIGISFVNTSDYNTNYLHHFLLIFIHMWNYPRLGKKWRSYFGDGTGKLLSKQNENCDRLHGCVSHLITMLIVQQLETIQSKVIQNHGKIDNSMKKKRRILWNWNCTIHFRFNGPINSPKLEIAPGTL